MGIHSDCKHCEWTNEKQWLDIDNDWDVRVTEPDGSDRRKITADQIYPAYNCKLEGVWVKCPKNPWQYLDLYYGKSWKTPMFSEFKNGQWQANPQILAENKKREEGRGVGGGNSSQGNDPVKDHSVVVEAV